MTTSDRSSRGLVVAAVVVAVAGLVAAVVLWIVADRRYDQAVEGFARAPVGCDTTLDFERTGTFLLFVETTGSLDEVPGDCEGPTEWSRDGAPAVSLTLLGPDDDEIDLSNDSSVGYDIDGFAGESVRSVDIDDTGLYRLTVRSDATDIVVSVGRDPSTGTGTFRALAVAIALGALVLAAVLAVLARRRRTSTMSPADAPWPAGGMAPPDLSGQRPPVGPPVAPPAWTPGGTPAGPPAGPPIAAPGTGPSGWPPGAPPSSVPEVGSGTASGADGRSPWAPPGSSGQ